MTTAKAPAEQFENVTVKTKANVYFDGKVVSHAVFFEGGRKKTLGLIFPGEFRFDTGAPELMEMTAGRCKVRLKDQREWSVYEAGQSFRIPGQSFFDIAVESGIAEYICSFE